MDIAATVLELILPKGASYYALGNSIFDRSVTMPLGVAAYHWITPQVLGSLNSPKTEVLPGEKGLSKAEYESLRRRVQDIQKIASWRVLKGMEIQ